MASKVNSRGLRREYKEDKRQIGLGRMENQNLNMLQKKIRERRRGMSRGVFTFSAGSSGGGGVGGGCESDDVINFNLCSARRLQR